MRELDLRYNQNLIDKFDIYNVEGIDKISRELRTIVKTPDFFKNIKALGIVIDSNSNPKINFNKIREALNDAGLPTPQSELNSAGQSPKVSILLMPGEYRIGTLEDLLLESVSADPSIDCIDNYIKCLRKKGIKIENNLSKAKIQIFLARYKDIKHVGIAAKRSIWPFQHPVFDKIREFVFGLAS